MIHDQIAETYISLALGLGLHDPDYVDAFYGPEELKTRASKENHSLTKLHGLASNVLKDLLAAEFACNERSLQLRNQFLRNQLRALIARIEMLSGKKLNFDEESQALYGAVAPVFTAEHFQKILDDLDAALPGTGSIQQKFDAYRSQFIIPADRLAAVFQTAVEESRKKTKQNIVLPPDENLEIEYVTGKPWAAYNWYKGCCRSVIQVNTELPITIDRALDLATHEGYPGHHAYNCLLETRLVRERNWIEFSIYPLFSPISLIAEGTANFGIELAFPDVERIRFEKEVLFLLAGFEPSGVEEYYMIDALALKLSFARNEAARGYLRGTFSQEEAKAWLARFSLMSDQSAEQTIQFFERYRSYVITYNVGLDLVRRHVERAAGNDRAKRWRAFEELLSSPPRPL